MLDIRFSQIFGNLYNKNPFKQTDYMKSIFFLNSEYYSNKLIMHSYYRLTDEQTDKHMDVWKDIQTYEPTIIVL